MALDSIRNYSIVGVSPPLNVEASQASPSDPVEVSWRPPSDGATTISGYRIFCCGGKNILVPPDIISIHFTTSASYVGQRVTVCTEAEQLTSQCTNATVVIGEKTALIITDNFTWWSLYSACRFIHGFNKRTVYMHY